MWFILRKLFWCICCTLLHFFVLSMVGWKVLYTYMELNCRTFFCVIINKNENNGSQSTSFRQHNQVFLSQNSLECKCLVFSDLNVYCKNLNSKDHSKKQTNNIDIDNDHSFKNSTSNACSCDCYSCIKTMCTQDLKSPDSDDSQWKCQKSQ